MINNTREKLRGDNKINKLYSIKYLLLLLRKRTPSNLPPIQEEATGENINMRKCTYVKEVKELGYLLLLFIGVL